MSLHYSPRLKSVIAVAESDASRAKADFVGTEHMLLALYDDRDSVAYDVLEKLGVTRSVLKEMIDRVCKRT